MTFKKFKKHFRIYFKNGHPAYIVDEDGNMYLFHRVTHSKTSGGRNNIQIENPLKRGGDKATYVVKREERDKKGRFSLFELELKPEIDVENLLIKKAGGSQAIAVNNVTTSTNIKSKSSKKNKENKKAGRTQIHLSDDHATVTSGTNIKTKHKKKGKINE